MKTHLDLVQKILDSSALEGRFIISRDTLVGAAATGNPNIVRLLGSHHTRGETHPFHDTSLRRALVCSYLMGREEVVRYLIHELAAYVNGISRYVPISCSLRSESSIFSDLLDINFHRRPSCIPAGPAISHHYKLLFEGLGD